MKTKHSEPIDRLVRHWTSLPPELRNDLSHSNSKYDISFKRYAVHVLINSTTGGGKPLVPLPVAGSPVARETAQLTVGNPVSHSLLLAVPLPEKQHN
jgi:hypothetical protein